MGTLGSVPVVRRREEGCLDEFYRQVAVQGDTGQHGGIPLGDGEWQTAGQVSGSGNATVQVAGDIDLLMVIGFGSGHDR